ncbi:unnamed protein product [Sphagnum jensenii]|uniref:PUM-HD domain-containing protein n=1 Tax=Sphagnum jensenii TaxID=128206 RepID=A0ABP0WW06_9BRYO
MEQDDEEFEQLLGEIPHVTSTNSVIDVMPRATSAPPHLEEVQRVRGSSAAAVEEGGSSGGGKCGGEDNDDEATPHMLQPFVDIRCDEHYESFYRSYAGVKKLPPPMDNRTLYSDFPVLSPKASSTHISPFLAELLPLDDDVPSHRSSQRKQQRSDMQRKQQQDALQQHQITSQLQAAQQQQHREPSPSFQAPAGAHQYGALSENDMSSNMSSDPHLTAAFGKLGFDEGGSNSLLQSLIDDAGDNNNRPIISNGSSAAGGGLVGRPPLSNGHGLNGSNGLYAHHMDTYGTGSTASYDLYASRSSPSLDLFQGKRLVSMNGLGNGSGSYDGMSDYAAEVSTEALKKAFRQQNSPGGYGSGGASQYQQQQQQLEVPPKYTTLEEVEGHIYLIAKDQHGCRFLQKKFDEGGPEDVEKIFREIISHITELMKDPFGNYLVQKLLEVCDEKQRMEILHAVTMDGELVSISLNMHGTRAVQKLIETLKSPEQVAMVIKALADGVVELIKDLNGNHVVQRCLQKLSHEDNQFIFDAAASHCVEIATHRHGCCVMQRCVDFAIDHQRQHLVAEVAANALTLSQDPYGNYVVQYILDLKTAWSSTEVMARLEGNYAFLSMQKFSSNVVEKCLKLGVEESRSRLVRELTTSPHLGQLLQDQYANYVIQSALSVCKGALHAGLVEAIRPHLPALRNSPYGKRILSRTNPKK